MSGLSPLACIDIGSNSVRLLVGRITDNYHIEAIHYDRAVTRLAKGIIHTGMLSAEGQEKTLVALKDFLNKAHSLGANRIMAIGTSALREAANGEEFLRRVLGEFSLNVEIISGKKEAELTARGALSSLTADIPCGLIVDIGGGSVEWAYAIEGKILSVGSVPYGVVKLYEQYIHSEPPSEKDLQALISAIAGAVTEISAGVRTLRTDAVFILTAGTATTLASIDLALTKYDRAKVHMHRIGLERLKGLAEHLTSMTLKERKNTPGLEPSRADLIIPGIHFTIEIMKKFCFDEVLISEGGLLEGALFELALEVRH